MRAFLLALALLLAAPAARAAAEGFSHQVILVGRVVDAQGEPAAGIPVVVAFHNLTAGSGCFGAFRDVTGPQGDFAVCRHAHELGANVTATLRVGNVTQEVAVDPQLRHGVAIVTLDAPREARDPEGDRAFHASLHVAGRAVFAHPEGIVSDEVRVSATPLVGMPVRVTATHGSTLLASANATTNGEGDYAVDLPLASIPNGTRVVAEASGRLVIAEASEATRRVDLDMIHAEPPGVRDRPGADVPAIPDWGPVGILALLAALSIARRRRA